MHQAAPTKLYIDGTWESGVLEPVIGAATGRRLATVSLAEVRHVDAAARAAKRASAQIWGVLSAQERAAILRRFADELEARAAELARRVSVQNGMPIRVASGSEAVVGPLLLRYYAGIAETTDNVREQARLGGGRTIVRHVPLGVVGVIVPWNFPVTLAFFKIAPALAAGNTIVWKPAQETVLDAVLVAEAAEAAGVPAGVLNVVPGGRDIGEALVLHAAVDKIAFTGSTGAGRAIAEACGRLLKPVSLELGGKSAAIVLDDADLPAHAADVFGATLLNSGQTCYLSSRVLVPRGRYAEIVDFFGALASGLKIGDPLSLETEIGPLATEQHRERVLGFIERAPVDGARLITGGGIPQDQPAGWFVAPTVFADVDPKSELAQDEVFGPVLAITPYDDDDEAVRIANDSIYGLAGTVWTKDEGRGRAIAERVHTGSLGINGYRIDPGAPFGGVGASGLGTELGPEGYADYTRIQTIYASFA